MQKNGGMLLQGLSILGGSQTTEAHGPPKLAIGDRKISDVFNLEQEDSL